MKWKRVVFILFVILSLSPWGSAPLALALGLVCALAFGNPFPQIQGKPTKYLLQASVVLLGFGMDIFAVLKAGREGVVFAVATIVGTLLLGTLLGRLLGVERKTSALISAGTAICGGSAIAAVGPAIDADNDEMTVSIGTVFILNSLALFIFPAFGHFFTMSQEQFGMWSAVAIHDTSSVVGAASSYGDAALAIATTVKLARALWIAPVALIFAYLFHDRSSGKKAKFAMPWFIVLFLAATVVRSIAPAKLPPSIFDSLVNLAKAGFVLTLFFIGASLSRDVIRKVGVGPLVEGIALWIAISITAFFAVMHFV
ncbi:MAG: putative sulfate exporter family transporter [Acidobacteria bacterium]|nr:putative sulfate exporter family transporter [Acidobacteriota bacterium]